MIWWKIYFWIVLAIEALVLIGIPRYAPFGLAEILILISGVFSVLAIYSYVYKKRTFSSEIWSTIFVFSLVTSALDYIDILVYPQLYNILLPFLKSNIHTTPTDAIIGLLIYLPTFYAKYQLSSFAKKKKK